MNPIRVLAAATAIELALATAAAAIAGLCGWREGWLDVINSFAPMIALGAMTAALLALASMPKGLTRTSTLTLAMVGVAYGAVMIGPELIRLRPASSAAAARPLKVLSANVWAQNPTPDEAIKAILAQDADLIALQEIDGSVGASASGLAARYPFVSPCAQRGVRIFSKTPILASGCPQMGTAAGVLDAVWVRVATAQGPAILLTTHFTRPYPPGLQAVDRTLLQTLVAELPPGPLIVTGDFNTTPWSYAMRTQDRLLKPLQRRSIAFPSWPARWTLVRRSWSLPLLPIDHIYTGADWPSAELRRIRVPSSDHFGFVAQIYHR